MPVTKVLYVEDDEIVRRAIVNYMTTLGYSMLQAADGQAGLDLFREEAPDVILTDLRMPKMDGLQLLSVIKDEAPDTPVIIVSGMGTIDDAVKALTLGAWDYIIKPVSDMAILEHAVNKALERSNLVRENKQYQRHLEEEVEKRTAELLQAQKMEAIGTLASGVAHDFNNMLNAILGYTDLLLQDTPAESRQYTRIAEISKAGQRAAELVNQILAFSRQTRQEPIALHMQRLIKECLTLLHGSLPATIEINEQIDALCGAIYADPTQIHQVIMNLATNAYHAMQEQGGRLGIELVQVELAPGDVSDLPPGPYARLRVTDSGHGIEPEIMQRIFDPYFSTKKSGEGTGLGLSTVHGIIKSHKGEITVLSKPGHGANFTVYLPVTKQEVIEEEKEREETALPIINKRVLFVDDALFNVQLGREMLSSLGCEVVGVCDSEEALQLFRDDPDHFDLVVTDQTMPKMTGMKLARKLLELRPGLPIIMVTGHGDLVTETQAAEIGVREFLMKPLRLDTLAQAMGRAISHVPAPSHGESPMTETAGPPPSRQNQLKPVDLQAIKDYLAANYPMEPDTMDSLIAGAGKTLRMEFVKMAGAMEAQDQETISDTAHTIKGCLLNLGITEWAECAKFIEKTALQDTTCSFDAQAKQLREGLECLLRKEEKEQDT